MRLSVFLTLLLVLGAVLIAQPVLADQETCDADGCDNKSQATKKEQRRRVSEPIILWWNAASGTNHPEPVVMEHCKHKCRTTTNRDYLYDPVAFYGTPFGDPPLPLPRTPNHLWALYHDESPMNNWPLINKDVISLFNFTATYAEKATWPITFQWAPSFEKIVKRKALPVSKKSKNGLAPAIYVQSNCNVPSDRTRYIEELMKHMKVDSYGGCLHNKDFEDPKISGFYGFDDEEFYDLIGQYKFTLSFENAICEGYMTEKLFRPLESGSVPVYYGAPNAKDYVPENSVIFVDQFENPKKLAEYLLWLDQNDDEYEKFLKYREPKSPLAKKFKKKRKAAKYNQNGSGEPGVGNSMQYFECSLCEALHTWDFSKPIIADSSHFPCTLPKESFPFQPHEENERRYGYGARRYIEKYELPRANEILDKVRRNAN